ncbi:trypsin-like peptidase domain-containing protein [Sphingobium yanoikuyae]|uniref:trypsin-like peptidase domain-containing protein n=1 Tax=Sphingobium yanoikuyae TaxID=13690 RepID=UPI00345EA5BF
MRPQTFGDKIIYSTIKITSVLADKAIATGTGFFFKFNLLSGEVCYYLFTNKHVISGADSIQININMSDDDMQFLEGGHLLTIPLDGSVLYHPDQDVDLCAIPRGNIFDQVVDGKRFFFRCLSEDNVPSDNDLHNLDTVEGVWMVGCPNGIYDSLNNVPIVRSGITATSPRLLYRGKQEFMVDMACFPGSSGSPIFLAPSYIRYNRQTENFDFGVSANVFLLGILYAGPLVTNNGEVILSSNPRVEVSSMMHLGYAIRSSRILDFKPLINRHLSHSGLGPLA